MVKNVHGGNKHKSQGRKFTTVKASNKLRIAENDGELYAIVTKMLGNGMFDAFCIDGITRLAHIRGKFSGRGKRDNFVEVGKWVLVGEREWDIQSNADKKKIAKLKCDLLEVYSDLDKDKFSVLIEIENKFQIKYTNNSTSLINPSEIKNDISSEIQEEKSLFNVTLISVPQDKKISILKIVRNITNLSLKESKDIVDNLPKVLKENISKEASEEIKKEIEILGGIIKID